MKNNINILIPMAGEGKRFEQKNYSFPKPIIPIQNMNGEPMIKVVIDNINIKGNYIYVCRKEHVDNYNMETLLHTLTPNCNIISINYLTEGSACTCLLAQDLINTNIPLLIADCDHYPIWDNNDFFKKVSCDNIDGCCLVFENNHPKFSYVKTNEFGYITEIKEKSVISNLANVGFYYWKQGSDFVKYAKQMVKKNIRVKNEFYTAPVFNEAIQDGKKITTYFIKENWELGTPEDLEYFINNYKK